MSLDSGLLSQLHDQIIDAQLGILHHSSRVARLERKIDTVLRYLNTLDTEVADKEHVRDLLRI